MADRPLRIAWILILLIGLQAMVRAQTPATRPASVAQWETFEVHLAGPTKGNPFTDVSLTARFEHDHTSIQVTGFYDGNGDYLIRFMPTETGTWTYRTQCTAAELDDKSGTFEVTAAPPSVHGMVRVAETYHFAYADGTPYTPIGTTCYNWTHQPAEIAARTLASLKTSPFNKVRMCVLSTSSADDPSVPFEGSPPTNWDFARFNPQFFRRFESHVRELRDAGIEADVILFHPYDTKRGFDRMPDDADDRYAKYVVARLAAYRNVWWSMANEYDLLKAKKESDFDRLLRIVSRADPYHHLLSIHHSVSIFDNTKPYITHASIQNGSAVEDSARAELYRDVWRKPVVYDEVKYEGDFPRRWGQLSGEELVRRFWEGTVAGTYVGHGEVLQNDSKLLWTSQGGTLHGTSPARIGFLRKIVEAAPPIDPIDKWQDKQFGGKKGEYYLTYFGDQSPREWTFALPRPGLSGGEVFHVDILDTWNMTITPVKQTFTTRKRDEYSFDSIEPGLIKLPGKPYIALRIVKVGGTGRTTGPDKPD